MHPVHLQGGLSLIYTSWRLQDNSQALSATRLWRKEHHHERTLFDKW
jgi:hypothetical protein